ncbi:DUF1036 domain-containing protein [Nodosilinea sp. LEGE 07088]|uniref:DUF1036 domain-containing protein n=1 Tax=Nodosilinea sp. LEGE 07088 TaxID=2777968 RepID=UPI0019F22FD2|nr:DUF1036 domain-containing protein [Nodosilinea sp. LEGE 07088]MBE9137044.1 DUF1036 domain-containing protein [Nodosilinea sp. LEGE 07088]
MKLRNIFGLTLLTMALSCPSAMAKFYLENRTDTSIQIGYVTLRGDQIRGRGWHTLQPGEDTTIEGNDYRINKRYFLVAKDLSTGEYLRIGNGTLCGDYCYAEYSDSDVYIPHRAFNVGFDNSYVADRLRSGSWPAFQEYISDAVRHSGFYIQPRTNCYDSSELYINSINGNTASIGMRVWDPASNFWGCGN